MCFLALNPKCVHCFQLTVLRMLSTLSLAIQMSMAWARVALPPSKASSGQFVHLRNVKRPQWQNH